MERYHQSNPRPLPSCERLHELLVLEDDGTLRWRVDRKNSSKAGSVAGCVNANGYRIIKVDGCLYFAHRIVWKMEAGVEPPAYIDHIDGDKCNNRPFNLRGTQNSQNVVNVQSNMSSNTSGFRGVSWHKKSGKWQAQVCVIGRKCHLGNFCDPIDAALVFDRAALAISEWNGYVTTNEVLGYIPKGRALTPAQAAAVDDRLKRHGLVAEKEPTCVLSECRP